MLTVARETINFYTKYFKTPTLNDINFDDWALLERQWSVFVTIYKNWEVRWSAWNIKEIQSSIAWEVLENTINAISKDERFSPLKLDEAKDLKIRIDEITDRKILQEKEILKLDPVKNWILVLKKDYDSMAMILPNIDPKLLTWEDFIPVLEAKLWIKNFDENDYIIYSIETEVFRD